MSSTFMAELCTIKCFACYSVHNSAFLEKKNFVILTLRM